MAISDEYKDLVSYFEKAIKIIEKMGMRILDFQKQSVKIMLPKEPNVNHIGTVYAGSLFSLAEMDALFASLQHRAFRGSCEEIATTGIGDLWQSVCITI